jgi:alpha-glucosidase (family GH31 glycosyl hydrolase)
VAVSLTGAAIPGAAAGSARSGVVVDGNARFEVLAPTLIRLEYAGQGDFLDGTTFNAVNRDFPVPAYTADVENGWRVIRTSELTLRYKEGSGPFAPDNTSMTLTVAGKPVTWAPSATPCQPGVVCQAETAKLAGGAAVATNHQGYSGSGFVDGFGNSGASVTWPVYDVPTTGSYDLHVRYSNNRSGDGQLKPRTLSLLVNGARVGQVTFPTTASWDDWATVEQTVPLRAGADTVALACEQGDTCNVNLDWLTVTAPGSPLPPPPGTTPPNPPSSSQNLGGWLGSLQLVTGPVPVGDGLLSRAGYYVLDDSSTGVRTANGWIEPRDQAQPQPHQDWYFFGYGHHYKTALADLAKLTGPAPLLPKWAFGNWYSRYYPYTTADYQDSVIPAFRQHHVPVDVLAADTDWKSPNSWNGWNWNPGLFPDPSAFLAWAHGQGLHVTLNVHDSISPRDPKFPQVLATAGQLEPIGCAFGIGGGTCYTWNFTDRSNGDSFVQLLKPFEQQGVRFWWSDCCDGGNPVSVPGVSTNGWIDYQFDRAALPGARAFTYARMGDGAVAGNPDMIPWADHRYAIHFTGDTYPTWATLAFEDYLTIGEGNIGQPYVTHDIGSFFANHLPDDLYARWVQFGAFQPILRLHSDHGDRLPWEYGPAAEASAEQAMRLHEALVPYSYTTAREAYDSGVPMVRGLYLDYPDTPEAYQFDHEYMYGDNMLVAPITSPGNVASTKVWFPPGTWVDYSTGAEYRGPSVQTIAKPLSGMPVYVKAGGIIPEQPYKDYAGQSPGAPEILKVYAGADGAYRLYDDAGDGLGYQHGQHAWTPVTYTQNGNGEEVVRIGAAQGAYPGQPASRTFDVQVVDASRPAQVLADRRLLAPAAAGSNSTGWWYDQAAHTVHINLPPAAVGDPVMVALEGSHVVQVPAPTVVGLTLQPSPGTVSATITNYGPGPINNVTVALPVPAGWTATPTTPATFASVPAGSSQKVIWQVTGSPASSPIQHATLQASAAYTWGTPAQPGTAQDTATDYITSPVQAPYQTFASTSPAYFGQQGDQFAIATDGVDVQQGAGDQYGAIYLPGAAGSQSSAVVRVDSQANTNAWAKAGIMIRTDVTKAGASPGYALIAVTPGNGVAFQWDGDSNGFIDGNINTGGGTGAAPIWLKLVRDGSTFTGYYSTNDSSWTKVGSATVPGTTSNEDVGMFMTSHAPGTVGQADFSGFQVSPGS